MNAALDDKGLTTVNMDRQDVSSQVSGDYSKMSGYICNSHARQHWFTVRRVGSVWYVGLKIRNTSTEYSVTSYVFAVGSARSWLYRRRSLQVLRQNSFKLICRF